MKQHSGGLGSFLNEVTRTANKGEGAQVAEQIVYIDIDELESNPRNFYGLRDVDALAGLIAVSHLVEPLTVSKKSDGKYMIISGHRRRAAVQKLLDEGDYTERKLPCIIKTRGKIKIEQENGEIIEFDEDAVEMLNLIASNRGQREERTVDEKLQEVKYLETFAKAIYHQKNRGSRGRFRNFFAEEILNMSKSQLQRISAMEKLTDKVRAAIDDKTISESAALAMSNMTAEEQDACLKKILSGRMQNTAEAIEKFKNRQKVVEDDDKKYYDRFDIIFKHDKVMFAGIFKSSVRNRRRRKRFSKSRAICGSCVGIKYVFRKIQVGERFQVKILKKSKRLQGTSSSNLFD